MLFRSLAKLCAWACAMAFLLSAASAFAQIVPIASYSYDPPTLSPYDDSAGVKLNDGILPSDDPILLGPWVGLPNFSQWSVSFLLDGPHSIDSISLWMSNWQTLTGSIVARVGPDATFAGAVSTHGALPLGSAGWVVLPVGGETGEIWTIYGSGFSGSFTFLGEVRFEHSVTSHIPEPETYAMLLAGLGLLGFEARRRKKLQRAA